MTVNYQGDPHADLGFPQALCGPAEMRRHYIRSHLNVASAEPGRPIPGTQSSMLQGGAAWMDTLILVKAQMDWRDSMAKSMCGVAPRAEQSAGRARMSDGAIPSTEMCLGSGPTRDAPLAGIKPGHHLRTHSNTPPEALICEDKRKRSMARMQPGLSPRSARRRAQGAYREIPAYGFGGRPRELILALVDGVSV